jgi:hypothetical protein
MDRQKNDEPASDFPRGIGRPATQALVAAGYTRLEQLAGLRAADLHKLHGMGPKALGILREALRARGTPFADDGA